MPKFRPTVVIGLGGTGKQVLVSLKRMIAENSPGGLNDFPFLRFLEIDTSFKLDPAKSKIQTLNERDLTLDPAREIFQLTGDWVGTPNLEDFPQINEWFPSELKINLVAADFKIGAGQKKPLGRFAFAWNAGMLYDKIKSQLDGIMSVSGVDDHKVGQFDYDDKLSIFICGSICGGTGAGTFLDTAYMVRHVAAALNKQVFINGMFAMSSVFDGMQGDTRIKQNSYASLVELDHFSNDLTFRNPYQRFAPAYKHFLPDYSGSAANRPFDYPFLFDRTNQKQVSFDAPTDLAEMIARFIFLLTGSEAAGDYEDMDSNVKNNLAPMSLLNKPNIYRSMGTFSFVYPKRLVKQLLGYTLSKRYFELILDKSYNSTEVQALTERFLNDYKFNPKSSLLDRFKRYKPQGQAEADFASYAQAAWEDLAEGEGGLKQTDKKLYTLRLREFLEQMELQFSAYRDQNATKAKDLKREFVSVLDKRISDLLSLARVEDKANGNKLARGSARRVENVLDVILSSFGDAKDRFKREEDAHAAEGKTHKGDFAAHLEEIQRCADSLIPQGGKLKKELEEARECFLSYFIARQSEFVKNQSFQLMDGIRDRLGDEDGLMSGLKARLAAFKNMCKELEEAGASVDRILADSTSYKAGNLVQALFNFRTDIDEAFERLWKDPDKGEEFILTKLSDDLRGRDCFGSIYERAQVMGQSSILRRVLQFAEMHFTGIVDLVNIEDRIQANPDSWENFRRGSFWTSANLFVQLNGSELSRVGIDLGKNEFFAITLPAEHYLDKPCKDHKGVIKGLAGSRRCPIDTDKENKLTCGHHGKCIKQIVLDSAPENVAIIHTSERGEINIIKSIAGYPLHALSGALVCQPHYKQMHEQVLKAAKANNLEEDQLHMFGPTQFPDLFERTEDYGKQITEFKATILLGYVVKKIQIERLSVRFQTAEDALLKRDATLLLGTNVDEVLRRFQSNRRKDRTDIGKFSKEMDLYLAGFFEGNDAERREKLFSRLKLAYGEMKSGTLVPDGFAPDEADSLNTYSLAHFKKPLVEITNTSPIDNF